MNIANIIALGPCLARRGARKLRFQSRNCLQGLWLVRVGAKQRAELNAASLGNLQAPGRGQSSLLTDLLYRERREVKTAKARMI